MVIIFLLILSSFTSVSVSFMFLIHFLNFSCIFVYQVPVCLHFEQFKNNI